MDTDKEDGLWELNMLLLESREEPVEIPKKPLAKANRKKKRHQGFQSSKQNVIPHINERPSAAVFTDLINQHLRLLVQLLQRGSR